MSTGNSSVKDLLLMPDNTVWNNYLLTNALFNLLCTEYIVALFYWMSSYGRGAGMEVNGNLVGT